MPHRVSDLQNMNQSDGPRGISFRPGNSPIPFRLHAEQMSVGSLQAHELLVGADFRYPAALNHRDAVGHAHGGEAMGYQDRRLSRRQFLKVAEDLVFGFGVHRSGGLVENQ